MFVCYNINAAIASILLDIYFHFSTTCAFAPRRAHHENGVIYSLGVKPISSYPRVIVSNSFIGVELYCGAHYQPGSARPKITRQRSDVTMACYERAIGEKARLLTLTNQLMTA